jgi:dUTP pyrophosphatase
MEPVRGRGRRRDTSGPNKTYVVPTGIKVVLPQTTRSDSPRSVAAKHGVTVLNSPGTVDEDYRGEVRRLISLGGENFVVQQQGMRVAQMVGRSVQPGARFKWTTSG